MASPFLLFLLLVFAVGSVAAQCGNGVVELGEDCDLGILNGASTACCSASCEFQPSLRQCRSSAGPCDQPEFCTGEQATCPPDQYRPNTFACRPIIDACDQVEYCTGLAVTCPPDQFKNSSTLCRASEGDCDLPEFCTGLSRSCPMNAYLPNTEMCRSMQGLCDIPEYCTGSTPTCPVDTLIPSGVTCRARVGRCDAVEECDGVSADCPVNAFLPNTTECRPSDGSCDPPEFCTGSDAECPVNVYAPSTQECRSVSGLCDKAENCTGIGPFCPVDTFLGPNTLCDAATAECDLDTFCTGTSNACPAKRYRRAGEECRAAQGPCDIAESCLGPGEASCPPDEQRDSSFVCRPAKSECDQEETCQGGVECPVDLFTNETFVCRASNGDCDEEERCTGNSPFCPPNLLSSISEMCAEQDPIQSQCTFDSFCTGLFEDCPANKVPDGVECTVDGNFCFKDTCQNGTCVRGPAVIYDDGILCNGIETCDTNTGRMTTGTPVTCDDGDSCTYDRCDETTGTCIYPNKPGTTGSCSLGAGGCLSGINVCDGSGPEPVVFCTGAVAPEPEICGDGIDNNCDSQVDEYCSLHGCAVDEDCSDIELGPCDTISCIGVTCTAAKKPIGTPCDYDKVGNFNGTCNAVGLCESIPISCNDNNPCTADYFNHDLGACVFDASIMYGSLCTSSDPTIIYAQCDARGYCSSVLSYECLPPSSTECIVQVLNETSLTCDFASRKGSCDDGNLCTKHDVCFDGFCYGTPTVCDDGLWCTTDECTSGNGECAYTLPAGFCYIDGKCYTDGDVNEHCACSVCNSSLSQIEWSFTYLQEACDDFDPCTHSDTCDIYTHSCVGIPIDCSANTTDCSTGVCQLGRCEVISIRENQACDDGDDCTSDDKCQRGVCTGDAFSSPAHSSQCMLASCVNGIVDLTPVDDYLACNVDADVCTGVYYCINGECVSDGPLTCPPSANPCVENVCEANHGCVEVPRLGQSCTDNNTCTIGDACGASGSCVPGAITLNCDDLDPCTDDFCFPDIGCFHIPVANCTTCDYTEDCSPQLCHQAFCIGGSCQYFAQQTGTSCSDGDACNGREVCSGNGVCISEGVLDCDDGNPCTDDTCDTFLGCQHTVNVTNSCSDGNACTLVDVCTVDGQCVGSDFPCPASTRCIEHSCEIINGTPTCVKHAKNVGAWCSDGDSCTHSDICTLHGECVGVQVECPRSTDCILSYSCVNGTCAPTYANIGTLCNRENLCMESMCDGAGQCVETTELITCVAPGQCRLNGICVPQTGECVYPLAADDSICDDSNACTTVDKCKYGECVGYEPVVCQNFNECHAQGICNPATGICSDPWQPNFSPCAEQSKCATGGICVFGECGILDQIDCPPSDNQCLTPRCDPNQGCLYDFSTGSCDDNNLCTAGETCLEGTCSGGTPVNCSHQNACGLSYCSPLVGCLPLTHEYCDVCTIDSDCPYFPCKNGTCQNGFCAYTDQDDAVHGCNDGQFCNGHEFCFAGTCMLGIPPVCDDNNECTYDSCTNNMCTFTPAPNITCTNGDLCATHAQCDGFGHCLSMTRLECQDINDCVTTTGCNAETGVCEYIQSEDGTPCLDENLCTTESACIRGICNVIKPRNCSSDYNCEKSGVCDVFTGQCLEPSSCDVQSCDDSVSCTLDDRCFKGECLAGIYSTCVSATQCILSVCNENGTCTLENVADQTPCDTGVPRGVCSGEDVCVAGSCIRTYAAGVLCRPEAHGGCDVADVCVADYDHCPMDIHRPNDISCPDSLFCFDSTCQDGVCVSTVARDCSSFNSDCTEGVCDEDSRACVARNLPDDKMCISGQENQCTPFSHCKTGVCTPYYANELTLCDDGDLCTRDSFCSGYDGTCTAGAPVDCTYLNSACGTGFCDALTGNCQAQSIAEGDPCNADSDPCTIGDFCHLGVCVVGDPVDCSEFDSSCQYGQCVGGSCVTIITGPECEPDYCAGGCTVPYQWWALHNSRCRSRSKRFRWPDDLENARICGRTYYQWSQRRARDAWRMLMHQWLATTLNAANGACVPPEISPIAANAFNLLLQCDMSINVTGPPGQPYRQLASALYAYNTGTKGPGTCLRPACARQRSSTYFSCLFPQLNSRDIFNDDVSPLDCANGMWDYVSDVCDCELGWAGVTCEECGIPDEDDFTFLCVPLIGDPTRYILRAISDGDLGLYINEDSTQLRQVLQLADRIARYPGDGTVDCACNLIEAPELEERSGTSIVVYGDVTIYVTEIERNLQDCEQVFDVVVYNNDLDCDPNSTTTIIIDDAVENCSQPTDWNYICDCCFADDDDCACPDNDVICLRNHYNRNRERKELYEILVVILMALTGLFTLFIVGYFIRTRNVIKKKKKEKEVDDLQTFLLKSTSKNLIGFGMNKKKRKE